MPSGEAGQMVGNVGVKTQWVEDLFELLQFGIAGGAGGVFDHLHQFVEMGAVPAFVRPVAEVLFHLEPLNVGDGDGGTDFSLRLHQHGDDGFITFLG